jgi:hypothetical protein
MNESKKEETQRGLGSVQRGPEIETAIETIRRCNEKEERLYAARGYGGYIETEEIKKIRLARYEAELVINPR